MKFEILYENERNNLNFDNVYGKDTGINSKGISTIEKCIKIAIICHVTIIDGHLYKNGV